MAKESSDYLPANSVQRVYATRVIRSEEEEENE
jgi:hypothetical protein